MRRNPAENEFQQAVAEVLASVEPVIERRPEIKEMGILERMVEPERMIAFRVSWVDDKNRVRVNRGYRGCDGSDYRVECPDIIWHTLGEAMQRITEHWRNDCPEITRKNMNLK